MPVLPRVARANPVGPVTRAEDPVPVWVILRWAVFDPSVQPGHAVAWTRREVLVRWVWEHPEGGQREDWFRAADVLREQPTHEELRELLARPSWA